MLNLDGILSKDDIQAVRTFTELRFADSKSLKTPEALVLWEEGYLSSEAIKQLCERYYGEQLYEPVNSYVPDEVLQAYRNTGCVPVSFESMKQRIVLVAVHDFDVSEELTYRDYTIQVKYTTLNYYLKVYSKAYGIHPCLREIPAKLSFESIIREAINLGAIDVTVDSEKNCTRVFYNVRKKRVDSAKVYSSEFMNKLIELLTFSSPMDMEAAKPKDLDVDLNSEYRGRVQINPTVYGFSVTIRLLPNRVFNLSLGDLSLSEKTKHFLETAFLDRTPGLRLMVGATMAGKNTTLLSVLNTIVKNGNYKVVSIEMPVEQKLPGVIQISAKKEEEFKANIESMIKANPDYLYVTEIRDSIGLPVVNVTNTGKCVFSTLHANGVSATISRLIDITGLSQDRVIQTLHSVCYQELVRNESDDRLYPRNRFVWFTDELKLRLYGKSLGEVVKIVEDVEDGD